MLKKCGVILLVAVTLFWIPASLYAQGPGTFPPEVAEEIQATLERQAEARGAPGAVVLIDAPQARFAGATGVSDRVTKTPLQPDDAFQIGSITKMFTATVILQLAEEGVLTLDDPLSAWLPDAAAGLPYGDQITLRHLLQHTSGVFNYTDDVDMLNAYLTNPTQTIEPQAIIDQIIVLGKSVFEPGTDLSYSNTNYILLGLVIEAATGTSYAETLRSRVLEPVGMTHTFLKDLEPATSDVVHGYIRNGTLWMDVTDWNLSWAWAAGALVSTPSDLALFVRALFNGDLFASDETLAAMLDVEASGSHQYGLGIMRDEWPGSQTIAWGHDGGTPGYISSLRYAPELDLVAVMLTNNGDQGMPLFPLVLIALEGLPE